VSLHGLYSYFALVDGLRRAPTSFSDLVYHSQIAYQFIPSDGQPRLVKFRLVPGRPCTQTGLLGETEDQLHPWDTKRPASETRSRYYLRKEFVQRMEGLDAVRYVLQIQISESLDETLWNPQQVRHFTASLSKLFTQNHCDMQHWHTLTAVLRSTQPSTLREMVE